ncbi:MAG: Protein-export membrane protein [uncultured bacterium]|uniref:Protein translocase subunit SecD n=1 Tax=Candidatus Gottesmanbacteria bacterium RIFCSPLOWO2_01_FULL_43_11b TaxID=1798392 RepID=A0A1F6AHW3_9BACT|nr:MAG: Protein-export membrane protein [uncultured bacterium]OGG24328.1 MAG: protein-export membrane protein SecD [Candidatus Gottesmanbacteria bacterium RIFCSPLOWO2_01_FULL_43_11b]
MRRPLILFYLLIALMSFLIFVNLTPKLKTHLGLDLSGGIQVTLEADMKDIVSSDRSSALESAKEVIERRVNLFGVSEPVVVSARSEDHYRIIVELPGVSDVDRATSLIGQTAKLEFREFIIIQDATESALLIPTLGNTKSVDLNGGDLRRSRVDFSPETGEPVVAIEFTPEGTKKFADITTRLVGERLAIFLDDVPITWPTVQTPITEGSGVITGNFTRDQARTLSLHLNAGALPVPVSIVEKRTIGATLGKESVEKSIWAGGVGLILVAGFMIAQYGWLGVLADSALIMYGLISLALFRVIPITLTMPGIAGFILSIGMAVDSNILIFERYREEKRKGKPWHIAIEVAFGKAWDSIRDANFTTLITCLILFNPGSWQFLPTSGLVRGFAVTLFIGVLVSLFTGIVVTRTFIRVLYREKT